MKAKPYLTPMTIVAICFCIALTDVQILAREFTSSDGKKIEASIVMVRGNDVVIKRGSKQYTVAMSRFSKADQDYMEEWRQNEVDNLIPRLKVNINSRKSDRSDRNDYFDDRRGSFQISVKVYNEELTYTLKDCTASYAVIGSDCENPKKYGIMQKASFKINLEPGKTSSWQGKALFYKFDDHAPLYWGSKYYGYVFQIKNAKGKVIYQTATPKKFKTKIDKILKFNVEQAFDKSMQNRERIYIQKM